ncbi:MAG: GntR family transcriptional regulator [Clostridia bacterium]|nr:GntR family transcriptional regulator [Clostridia bacterium]
MIFHKTGEDKSERHYVRLAREIRNDIEEGRLMPGQRMPTVKDMCLKSGLSAGTVRQAYGLLQTEGLIELTPGRGTFVSVPKVNDKSRKAQALEAIDEMFNRLSEMGFSQAESRMFVSLRLAQMDQDQFVCPVALIALSPETTRSAFYRLSEIPMIDLISFSVDEIRQVGAIALSEFPLVVCEFSLLNEVNALLSDRMDALCPFALAPAQNAVMHLARLPENAVVCVYGQSDAFFKLVKKTVKSLSIPVSLISVSSGTLEKNALFGCTHLITPSDVTAFAPDHELKLISDFTKKVNTAIVFDLVVDEGSMIAISRRVSALAERH